MESSPSSASAAWRRPLFFRRRPCTVVLDLRPLQCGYAGKGIGRYTYEMARRLGPLLADPQGPLALTLRKGKGKRPGFQVFSLVLSDRENPMPEIPVKILAPAWKRIWLWDQFFLPFLLARHRVHVFHNFVALGPLPQISLPGYYRSHVIATLHDWHMFAEDASPVEKFYRKTMRIRLQMRDLPKARRILTDSDKVREETLARGGVHAGRMAVVPVGCDHLDSIQAEPWYMENFALSVGDTPNKNLRFAYHVLALLRGRFVHVNWVVVGDRKRVLDELGDPELGRLPWITILEKPSDGLLKSCYQKALCLLFSSSREGFGIPVLEAMHLGCPVVAANVEPMRSLLDFAPGLKNPGNPEDWAEAVKTLLYSPEIRKEHIDHGLKRSSTYTWDAAVNAALAVYPT